MGFTFKKKKNKGKLRKIKSYYYLNWECKDYFEIVKMRSMTNKVLQKHQILKVHKLNIHRFIKKKLYTLSSDVNWVGQT